MHSKHIFHLFVWLVYGTYIVLDSQIYIDKKGLQFAIVPLGIAFALVAMLVYVNAYLLIPMLLEQKRYVLYATAVSLLIALGAYLRAITKIHWDSQIWPESEIVPYQYYKWNVLNSVWSILISTLLFYSQKWSWQMQQVKNIKMAHLETELKVLRQQLNPHFLFNGLNTIYGSIEMKNEEAREVVLKFSALLRYSLYDADTDKIELGKEVMFIENYINFQKLRNSSKLSIEFTSDIENSNIVIAPLLFINFLENAFKFKSNRDNRDNYIRVSLIQKDNQIDFSCENTCEDNDTNVTGIGIKNTERRFELLYSGKYQLKLKNENNIFSVSVTLTL